MSYIELKNISKRYGKREVLTNISLAVEEGEFVSIVGTSASGKTTFMRIVAGLEKPDLGTVTIAGVAVDGFPQGAAIVFQNYSLLPWLSAFENISLAVDAAFPDWTTDKKKAQVRKYLDLVGLGAAGAKKPRQLSGGMRQRVAIARAFAVEPRLLLLDEPFGALDALTRATLQEELSKLCDAQQPRATVIMISNSVDEAILLSDRVLALGPSPGSTLSAAATVTLPRPRKADALMHDEEAVAVRAAISEMLMAGHKSRKKPDPNCGAPAARPIMAEV